MLEYCLNCDYAEEIPPTRETVIISVCGEDIEAIEELYRCPACGEAFTSSLGHDALTEAYRKYRHRHGLLQPEEIRQWREQAGLTQQELSALLGWESTTLRWYENGALQEVVHDNLLKSLMQQPLNLLQLIEKPSVVLNEEKRQQLRRQLHFVSTRLRPPVNPDAVVLLPAKEMVRWTS